MFTLVRTAHTCRYESARLLHGRPTPLDKDTYDNVFVHFKPKDRRWYGMEVMEVRGQALVFCNFY